MEALDRLTVDGVPPSYDEMRIALGLATKSGVARLVAQLLRKGMVVRKGGARGLKVVGHPLTGPQLRAMSDDTFWAFAVMVVAEQHARIVRRAIERGETL